MMKQSIFIALTFITIFSACTSKDPAPYLNSDDADSLAIGYYLLGKKDVKYIPNIMQNTYDPRATDVLTYKGQSVYEAKMNAMKRISKLDPPNPISYRPDTIVVEFYHNWAIEKGYLKEE